MYEGQIFITANLRESAQSTVISQAAPWAHTVKSKWTCAVRCEPLTAVGGP